MPSTQDLSKLNQYRLRIDQIDLEVANLCRHRLELTSQVFTLKRALRLMRVDVRREAQIDKVFQKKLGPYSTKSRVSAMVKALLLLNPKYPKAKK